MRSEGNMYMDRSRTLRKSRLRRIIKYVKNIKYYLTILYNAAKAPCTEKTTPTEEGGEI
jgi:hypothetical protein